jgi:hypothetical protein
MPQNGVFVDKVGPRQQPEDRTMTATVTALVPFKLAAGKMESDLLDASAIFDRDFVRHQTGILRRELARKSDGAYMDIVQFRSREDMESVVKLEKESPACHRFFAVMDLSGAKAGGIEVYASLATYAKT